MSLSENTVVKPGLGEGPITWPHRILWIDRELGVASVIALPGAPGKRGKSRTYVGGPKRVPLAELEDALASNTLVETAFEAPGHWSMSDEEYLSAAPSKKERERRIKRLAARDAAWAMIEEIVGGLSIRKIAADPVRLRSKVLKQAEKLKLNLTTVYRTLHTYLAGGGARSSLIPNTHLRGAPGREKAQRTRKLGRKSRLEKAGESSEKKYVLTSQDKERLALGYSLRRNGRTLDDAYLLTCGVYWSTCLSDGKPKLFPANERPTRTQFKYWGKKRNTIDERKKRIGTNSWASKIAAGSTQDQVCAVGQMAMIDSTSTDVYLVSMMSRLKKLPPMHCTIVKEMRSTAMIGFYVGWENPSSATALQAILSSAESKADLCARFGIEIGDDDWPPLLCKLYIADNGEMKAMHITEAEKEFRFGVEYVRAYSGQSKSDVENQHHTNHKRLDHKVPGNTGGRQRSRGERHPAEDAVWNYYEYMQEFLRMAIGYNNEEVPHLAPTAMLKEGVAPTRINIMKWMMERGMRADIPYDVDHLRAYTLPSKPAVMTKTGIRLLMPDGVRQVPQIRFFAPELHKSDKFIDAVKNGVSVGIKVKFREDDLSHVWVTLPAGLTRIPNVSSDEEFRRDSTLIDHLQWVASEDLRKDRRRPEEDQAKLDTVIRREGITERAKKQIKAELDDLPKKPSKKAARSDLRRKRQEEMDFLSGQSAGPVTTEDVKDRVMQEAEDSRAAEDAMDRFMKEFT